MRKKEESVVGQADFERIDGVIHQVQVGSDVNNRTTYRVGQELMDKRLRISSIAIDRDFLTKYGKTHIVIMVHYGDSEKIFMEIVDQVILTHNMDEVLKGGSK